ncbi:MAG: recombinase family protein [Firmicutes bacterium]|nr:recombinase family protein [Bacillota bacterium]
MKRKVAIYARVSTEHEAQLSALDNQVQYYDNILAMHPDWELYKRYIDEGITGTSVKKRRNFLRMIEDAKNGCFDLIVTREVSRFARNTVDTLQETRKLKRIGVEVYFTEDNIWTFKDDDGELKLTIMATLAQNESKKTSQRVKAGQKISFENGVVYGTGNILGYDRVGNEMVINPEQAEVVKFIFESFLKGNGTTKIKYELESKGILTATGLSRWSAATITRILQNPFYCGTMVYRKYYVPDFLEQKARKNNGEVEQVVVEGNHEKIISKEDFQKVQDIIKEHSKHITQTNKRGTAIATNVWSKKLVCECGSTFNRRTYHKYDGIITYCYQCYNQKNNGSTRKRLSQGLDTSNSCDVPVVSEWKLSIIANSLFTLFCNDKERILKVANKLLELCVEDKEVIDNEKLDDLNSKLSTNQRKLDKLLDMYLNEMVSKDSYISKKEELETTIKVIKDRIEELAVDKSDNENYIVDKIRELKKLVNNNLTDENSCISDSLIDSLIQKVTVEKDKFIVKINCGIKSNEEDVLLTKLIITKDNVDEYQRKHHQYKRLRLKQPIIVDVVI